VVVLQLDPRNVAANTPWDVMARNLGHREGLHAGKRRRKFFVLHEDPKILAETTSIAFMACRSIARSAQPSDGEVDERSVLRDGQNLFARVRTKNAPGDGNRIVFSANEGDLVQPLNRKTAATAAARWKSDVDRFARRPPRTARDWLVSRDNPYFTRAITNRIWQIFSARAWSRPLTICV